MEGDGRDQYIKNYNSDFKVSGIEDCLFLQEMRKKRLYNRESF